MQGRVLKKGWKQRREEIWKDMGFFLGCGLASHMHKFMQDVVLGERANDFFSPRVFRYQMARYLSGGPASSAGRHGHP